MNHYFILCIFLLLSCKVTAEREGAVEGAAPVDLGQCSWVGEQGHDHAVIIPLFHGAVSKRNGKCL